MTEDLRLVVSEGILFQWILVSSRSKFDLGRLVLTRGIVDLIEREILEPMPLLIRHTSGDWGDLSAEDVRENELALEQRLRIFSSYETGIPEVPKIWIITEADRSATTILLPEEY